MTTKLTFRIFAFLLFVSGSVFSQVSSKDKNWDNQIYMGNKVSWGSDRWKYSSEIQVRLEDNFQSLDRWYVEGVAAFLVSI